MGPGTHATGCADQLSPACHHEHFKKQERQLLKHVNNTVFWIRIRMDTCWFWSAGSGSGSRWPKITDKKGKSQEMCCLEVLDALF
jgi:hypothetical protein